MVLNDVGVIEVNLVIGEQNLKYFSHFLKNVCLKKEIVFRKKTTIIMIHDVSDIDNGNSINNSNNNYDNYNNYCDNNNKRKKHPLMFITLF